MQAVIHPPASSQQLSPVLPHSSVGVLKVVRFYGIGVQACISGWWWQKHPAGFGIPAVLRNFKGPWESYVMLGKTKPPTLN